MTFDQYVIVLPESVVVAAVNEAYAAYECELTEGEVDINEDLPTLA